MNKTNRDRITAIRKQFNATSPGERIMFAHILLDQLGVMAENWPEAQTVRVMLDSVMVAMKTARTMALAQQDRQRRKAFIVNSTSPRDRGHERNRLTQEG